MRSATGRAGSRNGTPTIAACSTRWAWRRTSVSPALFTSAGRRARPRIGRGRRSTRLRPALALSNVAVWLPARGVNSALPALFGLAVQPIRQTSRALLRLSLAFGRGRDRRRRSGVPGQAERFEPLGLRAQRRGRRFILGSRLFGVVGALDFGELRTCLMFAGFIGHLAILFH